MSQTSHWNNYVYHGTITEGCRGSLISTACLPVENGETVGQAILHCIVDTGYVDADLLVSRKPHYGIRLVGPVLSDNSWQAKAGRASRRRGRMSSFRLGMSCASRVLEELNLNVGINRSQLAHRSPGKAFSWDALMRFPFSPLSEAVISS